MKDGGHGILAQGGHEGTEGASVGQIGHGGQVEGSVTGAGEARSIVGDMEQLICSGRFTVSLAQKTGQE